MKKILVIIIIFISFFKVKGQEFNDSLYYHLYNYQKITGDLKLKLNKNSLNKSFHIVDLVDGTNTGCFKIYRFYNLIVEDHSVCFLIIENEKVEIYNILSYNALIDRILDDTTNNERTKILWAKEVLKRLRDYYEEADMGSLVIRKDYGKYMYFMPLNDFKSNTVVE